MNKKMNLLLFLFFLLANNVFSANKDSLELISVKARILYTGYYNEVAANKNMNKNNFFVFASITNNQDTAISFYLWTCDWPIENFTTDNDSIYIKATGCDANFPKLIKLKPHQTISFNSLAISHRQENPKNNLFRIGFCFYDTVWHVRKRPPKNEIKWYWSNPLTLVQISHEYTIED
ncbi:MAG: hypothetical protein HY252_02010 [Sphingobacteriales bacterium]|nr:hypothetical protein [Sphingobacteriales bacterium]